MKKITPKILIYALLSSALLFVNNVAAIEAEIVKTVEVIQQNVNLNKSTVDDLVTLKGVGLKKAQAILAYRQEVGRFKSIDELIKIKGIGKKVLMDNKARLTI